MCYGIVTKSAMHKVLHPSVFKVCKQRSKPYSYIGVVFSQSQLLAYVAADDIVAFFLQVLSHILPFETEGVQAAISRLPVAQSFSFKKRY